MKYAFFPGCSLESTGWDFDRSTRAVCRALGIELVDIPDWVCCGSTPAHTTNASLSVALPVMNLQKAKEMGLPVLTACASCYARLRTANHTVLNDPEERTRAERVTGKPYDGSVEVRHLLDVLVNDLGVAAVREKVRKPLKGIKTACYYGCLLTRPPDIVAFDDAEHPSCMDQLLTAIGAEPVEWPYKTECCGASLAITRSEIVNRLESPAPLHGPPGRGALPGGRLSPVRKQPRPAAGGCGQGPRSHSGDAGAVHHAASGTCPGTCRARMWDWMP